MENEKVKYLIDMINDMDIKDKLRLALRISDSSYTNLKYDKPETYKQFDTKLKKIDQEYRSTIINFNKYPIITFSMAKVMELDTFTQDKLALYLFNIIA